MQYTAQHTGSQCHITLSGRFTFSDSAAFRPVLDLLTTPALSEIILDFSQTEFIDSAALGMLLLLREEARQRNIDVRLINAYGQIKKMFELVQFHTIFAT